MGSKLFTSSAFDTALCAAACSAQSAYNLRHPPANGPAKTCQFYNTYGLYKNLIHQGQYCALYNQTWNVTYATNKGQYRGSDHYTIQSSYISSNATYPGLCAQAVTQTSLDLTATTFSYPPQVNIQTKTEGNLATIHYQRNDGNYYYVIAFIQYPVIANQIYEVTFDYYQEVTTGHDASYFVEVGDNDYNGFEAYIRWYQEQVGTPTERSQYDRYASMSGDNSEMEPCWKDKVMPQTFPRSGVWNTAKLYMKPETDSAHLRWDFSNVDTSGLQWKNVYVTQLPADYCRKGN